MLLSPLSLHRSHLAEENEHDSNLGELSPEWAWGARYPQIRWFWLRSYWGHPEINFTNLSNLVVVLSIIYAFVPDTTFWDNVWYVRQDMHDIRPRGTS